MRRIAIGLAAALTLLPTARTAWASLSILPAEERAYLGVQISPNDDGVEILSVVPATPAAAAGLEAGDVVIAIDGKPIGSIEALGEALATKHPGDRIEMKLRRGAKTHVKAVTLGRRDAPVDFAEPVPKPGTQVPPPQRVRVGGPRGPVAVDPSESRPRGWLGVYVEDDARGLKLTETVEGGPAAEAGLESGDVIVSVDGKRVGGSEVLVTALARAGAGRSIDVTVMRGEMPREFEVKLRPHPDDAVVLEDVTFGIEDAPTPPRAGRRSAGSRGPVRTVAPAEKPRGWLGVYVEDAEHGVRVDGTVDGGPSEKAGLAAGDVIILIDGREIGDGEALRQALQRAGAGKKVAVTVLRGETPREFDVRLGENPESQGVMSDVTFGLEDAPTPPRAGRRSAGSRGPIRTVAPAEKPRGWLGVYVEDAEHGVRVDGTVDGGPSEKAGLAAGDVIILIDGHEIGDGEALRQALQRAGAGKKVAVTVLRGETPREFDVRLGENPESAGAVAIETRPAPTPLLPEGKPAGSRGGPFAVETAEAPRKGGFLGIMIATDPAGRALVASVQPGSPAARGKLETGDVVLALDGHELADAEALKAKLAKIPAGTEVEVTIDRGGEHHHRIVKLAGFADVEWDESAAATPSPPTGLFGGPRGRVVTRGPTPPTAPTPPIARSVEGERGYLGVSIEDADEGVRILEVHDDTAAERAGLKSGDVLTRVGDTRVRNTEQLLAAMAKHRVGQRVEVRVERGERVIETMVRLGKRPAIAAVDATAPAAARRAEGERRRAEQAASRAERAEKQAVVRAERAARRAAQATERDAALAHAEAQRVADRAKARAQAGAGRAKAEARARTPRFTIATRGPKTQTVEEFVFEEEDEDDDDDDDEHRGAVVWVDKDGKKTQKTFKWFGDDAPETEKAFTGISEGGAVFTIMDDDDDDGDGHDGRRGSVVWKVVSGDEDGFEDVTTEFGHFVDLTLDDDDGDVFVLKGLDGAAGEWVGELHGLDDHDGDDEIEVIVVTSKDGPGPHPAHGMSGAHGGHGNSCGSCCHCCCHHHCCCCSHASTGHGHGHGTTVHKQVQIEKQPRAIHVIKKKGAKAKTVEKKKVKTRVKFGAD